MRTFPISTPLGVGILLLSTCGATLLPAPVRSQAESPLPTAAQIVEIKQLVRELADVRFPVRRQASERLQAIGLAALPALEEAAQNDDPEVRQRAWQLIDAWAAEGKVPALLFQLSGRNNATRAAAAESLGKIGAAARLAIPALSQASNDQCDLVRCSAREALKNIQQTPEINVEVVDLDGTVKVGGPKRYEITITNTGSAPATQVHLVGKVPAHLAVMRIDGPEYRREGQRIEVAPMTLEPNSKVRWEICTKVLTRGKGALPVEVSADQLSTPLRAADNLPAQSSSSQMPVPVPQPTPHN